MKQLLVGMFLLVCTAPLPGQVSYERLLNAENEPEQWLTYSGAYHGRRYSKLDQIRVDNAKSLDMVWVYPFESREKFQSTPLVVDGVMYVTEPPSDVIALDAATGRQFWKYTYKFPQKISLCCGRVNRGVAILGETLFLGTVDAHLVALDAKNGAVKWDVTVADYTQGYALTMAPLVVKDKVITGVAGGEYGIRGFLEAYDATTGKRAWRFNAIPGPGEPGHETWKGDAWQRGGGSAWLTGSYDPELNLLYWGLGNPSPDWNADVRPGDNLYTDSVVALNPDDGKLKWYFQFTPHDEWDYDSVQIPVLVDREFRGRHRKLLLWGNRNAFFYVLDRVTGEFLHGKAFAHQTWAKGLDDKGRPIKVPGAGGSREGTKTYPSVQGATNWYSPTYSPRTGLFYLVVWDQHASTYYKGDATYTVGNRYTGSLPRGVYPNVVTDEEPGYGAVRALNPESGDVVWEYKTAEISESGLLSTAGDVVFAGSYQGHFMALDARDGKLLWRVNLGGRMTNSPITYMAGGKQYVSVGSGHSLFTFALGE